MTAINELARLAFRRSKQSRAGRLSTALVVLRVLRRTLKQKPVTMFRAEIKPGEGFEIRGIAAESTGRRARKRTAARK